MKRLINKNKDPMTVLIDDLFQLCKGQVSKAQLSKVLSGYKVEYNESDVIFGILPEFVKVGNQVHITREVDGELSWNHTGKVLHVWYRGIKPDTFEVVETVNEMGITDHPDMRKYEESRPMIYDRIVLSTEDNVLIVPCVKGMRITEVK